MIAVKRPAGNPTVMPSSARTAASPSPYTRTTSAADTSRGSDTFMTGSVPNAPEPGGTAARTRSPRGRPRGAPSCPGYALDRQQPPDLRPHARARRRAARSAAAAPSTAAGCSAGLRGRVVELGAGSGVSFAYYPATVTELVAVEPEAHLRAMAQEAARARRRSRSRVVEGVADAPARRGRVDGRRRRHRGAVQRARPGRRAGRAGAASSGPAASCASSSTSRPARARLARLQRALDATVWPRLNGGCHTHRDTEAAIRGRRLRRSRSATASRSAPTPLGAPVAPRILGRARRPAEL